MSAPRSVVVESGTHLAANLGDLAMLQALVGRLRTRWPDVRVRVPTLAAGELARHCPEAEPLPATGRYAWLPEPRPPGLRAAVLDRARGGPAPLARAAARRDRSRDPDVGELVGALRDADAFVLAGRGGTTDAFTADSLQTLALVRAAVGLGLPSAALGQGFGPARDPVLLRRARAVLPRLDVIGVREPRAAPALLAGLGVDARRVLVTGDDALFRADGGPAAGTGLGVGLRATDYAGMGPEQVAAVGAVLRGLAERLGAPLVALPVDIGPDGDAAAIARATGGAGDIEVRDVDGLVAATRGCRAVVAGSYHAAVFALAVGVPAVGLWSTEYYRAKLEGVAAQFGAGCFPVALAGDGLDERLTAAVEAAWQAGPDVRGGLVAARERQVAAAQAAFDRFADLVEARLSPRGRRRPRSARG